MVEPVMALPIEAEYTESEIQEIENKRVNDSIADYKRVNDSIADYESVHFMDDKGLYGSYPISSNTNRDLNGKTQRVKKVILVDNTGNKSIIYVSSSYSSMGYNTDSKLKAFYGSDEYKHIVDKTSGVIFIL